MLFRIDKMVVANTVTQVRELVSHAKAAGKTIGLVPTMGALHQGHTSLMDIAKSNCDFVVASIFVNPTQFGPNEDFDKYPRTFDADCNACEAHGVDVVFAPAVDEMYGKTNSTWVSVEGSLTTTLCGASRPGHFRGVTTVCCKLFNIVGADRAFFGQKDAQQVAVIKKMVKDLNLPLEICVCPIVREESGLAMSSRNKYLSDSQREQAIAIFRSLMACKKAFAEGETECVNLKNTIESVMLQSKELKPEYIEIVNPDTLQALEVIADKALVAVAAKVGSTRLIDNIVLDLNNIA